jgi:hypothetical protein
MPAGIEVVTPFVDCGVVVCVFVCRSEEVNLVLGRGLSAKHCISSKAIDNISARKTTRYAPRQY